MLHPQDTYRRHKKWSEWRLGAKVGVIAAAVVLIPGLLVLFAAVTMWLWNWLMPAIFKLPAIGFWQAVGILLLSHILFKGGSLGRAARSRRMKARVRERMAEEGSEVKAE
jgi:hypothetical protein